MRSQWGRCNLPRSMLAWKSVPILLSKPRPYTTYIRRIIGEISRQISCVHGKYDGKTVGLYENKPMIMSSSQFQKTLCIDGLLLHGWWSCSYYFGFSIQNENMVSMITIDAWTGKYLEAPPWRKNMSQPLSISFIDIYHPPSYIEPAKKGLRCKTTFHLKLYDSQGLCWRGWYFESPIQWENF